MPRLTFSATFDHPVEEVFRWHARPGAFERLVPPWDDVTVRARRGTIVDGDELEMSVRQGPLAITWLARHEGYVQDRQFVDVQVRGPFARWRHVHQFAPLGPAHSTLHDQVDLRLPLHPVSDWIAGRAVARRLARLFAFRHQRTQADLDRHRRFADRPRLRVGIAGADQRPGRALAAFLATGGHDVCAIERDGDRVVARAPFDVPASPAIPPPALDALILTAASDDTWGGAHHAFDVIGRLPIPPRRLIVACPVPDPQMPLLSAASSSARDLGVGFAVVSTPALTDWVSCDTLIESVHVALMLGDQVEPPSS
ncbi:MAG: SRPBCC family protein [Vicinamibacterales bacterium]|nr:SRPBCC family protein [Vicinamibacterales bacterium]